MKTRRVLICLLGAVMCISILGCSSPVSLETKATTVTDGTPSASPETETEAETETSESVPLETEATEATHCDIASMKAAGKKIADFTDEELVEFMREYAIPSHFRSYDVLETLKGWAAGLDEEPFMPTPYSYTETAVLARICWLAAASYYDWDYKYPEYNYPHGQRYVRKQALEQNTVFRVDEESMGFSDYAYLIGGRKVSNAHLDILVSPFIEYAPGGNTVTTLQDIVETIKGYPDTKREIISFSGDRPEWGDLKEDEFALAIRQGTDGKYLSDVYFMRLTKDGWVHKPGASNTVLLFNQPLDESVDWISEMSLDGETFYQGSIVFSGPINYIIYRIKEPTGNWEEP